MEKYGAEDECIEFRHRVTETIRRFSVMHYEDRMKFVKCLANERAISFHDVRWTKGAPRVEQLTPEWQETEEGSVRICDPSLYDRQMRELVGLA